MYRNVFAFSLSVRSAKASACVVCCALAESCAFCLSLFRLTSNTRKTTHIIQKNTACELWGDLNAPESTHTVQSDMCGKCVVIPWRIGGDEYLRTDDRTDGVEDEHERQYCGLLRLTGDIAGHDGPEEVAVDDDEVCEIERNQKTRGILACHGNAVKHDRSNHGDDFPLGSTEADVEVHLLTHEDDENENGLIGDPRQPC